MRFALRIVLLALPVVMIILLPACGGGGGGGAGSGHSRPRISVVSNNPAEFWTYAEAGAIQAGKDFDAEVVFRKPEKGDVPIQMDILKTLVQQGFDGIAVSVINPEEQSPELRVWSKQTKLIAMDNDAPTSNRICYVGTNNYEAGKTVGRLVKEAMPNGGTLAIFVGQITPLNARERFQGVVDELAGQKDAKGPTYGKFQLHRNEAITDGANPQQAQNNARAVLEQIGDQPNVGMVGLWAYNPPAILEAARSKMLAGKITIVGFDEDEKTLDGITDGSIYATVVQDPYNFGYKSVEILVAETKGDTSKRTDSAVPHRVINKSGKAPEGDNSPTLEVGRFREQLKLQLEGVK
jgi:ribose transport system substrate-binding protein